MKKYQSQKDINGCGIASLANLLDKPYGKVKNDFEKKYYSTKHGINVFDIVRYLKSLGLKYELKFFNQNPRHLNLKEANKYSKLVNSITLIVKSEKYPVGHYLLRTKSGWIDPWYNLPNIDTIKAGVRKKLPTNPWYVIYPVE